MISINYKNISFLAKPL